MTLNSQTKTLLVVAIVLFAIYFFYKGMNMGGSKNNTEEGFEDNSLPTNIDNDMIENMDGEMESEGETEGESMGESESMSEGSEENEGFKSEGMPVPNPENVKYFPAQAYAPPESDWLKSKFDSRNRVHKGYKRVSYSGDRRGDLGPSDWAQYFDHNNDVIGNSQTGENDKFLPVDETSGSFAVFKSTGRATCGSNQNCEPEDLFDVDKYLPQEVNDDWFEVQPEPISVKNRHLINITKPIGINTIGSSLRNASYDIRGAPSNPKFITSPWLNSSIEPDVNLKPLY